MGRSIATALKAPGRTGLTLPYNWHDTAQRRWMREDLGSRVEGAQRVAIIWAAGRTGFGSTPTQMDAEAGLLGELADFAVARRRAGQSVSFHLTSSAGGLFEGQNDIGTHSQPSPQRPYGEVKLAQEALITEAVKTEGLSGAIYRPSSVYGYVPDRRLGLIATLILNTLQGKETLITGSRETLRDYVLAEDAGKFIAGCALRNAPTLETHLLASGQAASIGHVIERVTDALGQTPILRDETVQSNAAHMTFQAGALPPGLQRTPFAEGVRLCAALVRAHLGV